MKKDIKAILFYILTSALPLLVSIMAIPYVLSELGVQRFGYLTIMWVLVGYFSIFDLGLGRVMTREVSLLIGSNREKEIQQTVKSVIALMTFLAITAAIAAYLLSHGSLSKLLSVEPTHEEDFNDAMRWLALAIPAVIYFGATRGLLEAFSEFTWAASTRAIVGSCSFIGPVIACAIEPNLENCMLSITILRMVTLIAPAIKTRKIVSRNGHKRSAAYHSPLRYIRAAGWMTVSNIVSPIMVYSDRFIIAAVSGAAAVTHYSTPFDLVSRLSIIPEAIFAVIFPATSRVHATQIPTLQKIHNVYEAILGLFMAVIATVIIVCGDFLLSKWLGQEFADASWRFLAILSAGMIFNFAARASFTTLQAQGMAKYTAVSHLIELPVYILTLISMTTQYGLTGAAYAWLIRAALDMVLLKYFASKQLQIKSHFITALIGLYAAQILLAVHVIDEELKTVYNTLLVSEIAIALAVGALYISRNRYKVD